MRRHRGFSAHLRRSHFLLASNPLPGTRPADSTALLFLHVCQMWRLDARTHTRTHTDVVSSSHLFRHLSLPSETEFVNSVQTTRLTHTLYFTVPLKKTSTFFLIKFLKRLLNLFNFSCLRVRVYHQQLQNLNNLKKRNALDHHMSSISTKALQDFK